MSPIRIHIYDDEADVLNEFSLIFKGIFDARDINTEILPKVINSKDGSFLKEIASARPEIVIFDNYFGKSASEQMFGQNLISELKEDYPDVIFILLTKESIPKGSLGQKFPMPDIIVSKFGIQRDNPDYKKWVFDEISSKLHRARIETLEFDSCRKDFLVLRPSRTHSEKHSIKEQEIVSLIQQVCHTGGQILENVIEGVRLTPLQGGLSNAVVCSISIKNKYGNYKVPAVIKFMPKLQASREAHNHAKFVKWVLPYRWRVDLIGKGLTGTFGAVCYSFAHGGTGSPETMSEIIGRRNEKERILNIMRSVFDPDSQAWYSNQKVLGQPLLAYLSTNTPYFNSADDSTKREEGILDLINQLSPDDGVVVQEMHGGATFAVISEKMINVSEILNNLANISGLPSTTLCLSHGDLNSSNILVRQDSIEFCFIDFQYTGWHHRARDFCSLEGSIRTLQFEASKRSFTKRFTDEILAWKRCVEDTLDATCEYGLIDELRLLFFKNHNATAKELALASVVHTWWLLSFSTWNQYQRNRLLSYFMATLYCLQDSKFFDGETGKS